MSILIVSGSYIIKFIYIFFFFFFFCYKNDRSEQTKNIEVGQNRSWCLISDTRCLHWDTSSCTSFEISHVWTGVSCSSTAYRFCVQLAFHFHDFASWTSSRCMNAQLVPHLTREPRERSRLVPYISGISTIFALKNRWRYGQTAYRKELCAGTIRISLFGGFPSSNA